VEEAICQHGVVESRWLKQLQEENAKLKRLVADLCHDKTL
jgi:hypothetical protein